MQNLLPMLATAAVLLSVQPIVADDKCPPDTVKLTVSAQGGEADEYRNMRIRFSERNKLFKSWKSLPAFPFARPEMAICARINSCFNLNVNPNRDLVSASVKGHTVNCTDKICFIHGCVDSDGSIEEIVDPRKVFSLRAHLEKLHEEL